MVFLLSQSFERGLGNEIYALIKVFDKDKNIVTVTVNNFANEISKYLRRVKRYTFVFPASEAETTKRWLLKSMSFEIFLTFLP